MFNKSILTILLISIWLGAVTYAGNIEGTSTYDDYLFILVHGLNSDRGSFTGVGGDADFFPNGRLVITGYFVPLPIYENNSSSSILGAEANLGNDNFSFNIRYGEKGGAQSGGMGIRKKIYGDDNLFSLTLVWDGDGVNVVGGTTTGSCLGGIISKRFEKIYPYLGVFSTTYYNRTEVGSVKIDEFIYGSGFSIGARYIFDEKWSGRAEAIYNSYSVKSTLPWPKSIMSTIMAISYRI